VAHSQKAPRHVPTHGVKVAPGSRLAGVLGVDALRVNSLHHQAIKALGRGLRVVAAAEDGIVEGVELEDETRFVLGVQWHPEEMVAESEAARRLFRALVEAAARRSARPRH
jgi:putative glutamine amidotransferase